MRSHRNSSYRQAGFTLVEMLVMAPIVILAIGGFIAAAINTTGDALVASARNTMTYSAHSALERIEDDVRVSAGFLALNSFTPVNGQGDGGTTIFFENATEDGNALILRNFATTAYPQDPAAEIVVRADSPYFCSQTSSSSNTPLIMNIVYFVRNDSLWRRVMMPSGYDTGNCNAPWQLPSCEPGYTATFCKTDDEELVEDVTGANFSINYYASANSDTPSALAIDPDASNSSRASALDTSLTIEVTITVERQVAGELVTEAATDRMSRSYANVTPEFF